MQIRKKLPIVLNVLICMPVLILVLIIYMYLKCYTIEKGLGNIKEGAIVENSREQVRMIADDERVIEYIQNPENTEIENRVKDYLQESIVGQDYSELFIIDAQENIILSSGNVALDTGVKQEEIIDIKVPIITKDQNVVGTVCMVIDDEALSELTKNIQVRQTGVVCILDNSLWGLLVITVLILMMIINIVSKKFIKEITEPIDLLIEAMNGVEMGDLGSFCRYEGKGELGMLSLRYNQMLKKLGDSHRNLGEVCEELEITKQALESNYQALEKSKKALVMSEERYKMALDAIDEVIWEYHAESGQFFATDNWKRIIGEELKEESIMVTMERFLEPRLVESMAISTRRCLSGEIRDFTQELWIMKKDKKCCLLCKGHAIVGENGQVEKMMGILTDITYNKSNEERVRRLTFFDGLTGCLNKSTFIESVDTWLGSDMEVKKAAIFFIDLDDFKKINDVLSHEIGDKVLNYVGKTLTELLPPDAFIGRFGGDEFVIFKSGVDHIEEIHKLVYGILGLFQDKLEIEKLKIHLTCSMGIAIYPEDGEDSAMLLKNADTAMHKVKDNGKNSYSFYTRVMSQTLDRKLLVEEALREAVDKNSFYLQYQPIIDLQSQKTTGCEALIRLYDSDLGFISPGEFIPIAEETDLIIEAGDWVLENALKTLSYLNRSGYNQFTMNINVSSIQIREEDFLDKLVKVIKETGVLPQCIKLEVTESVLMEDIEKSIELFNHVKAMGIKIALDDFGTGYSSLNYLRSIPLDVLKIDKSFVDEITTSKVLSEIVDSIINMAHALEITVVAEGVENEMQLEVLRKKGCDFIQGYYFSKPLSEKEFEARLKKENHIKPD